MVLQFIYALFIAPLEFLMQQTFDLGYAWTGSSGLAIILMCLVVNTVILPIYNRAESWQEKERALRQKMAAKEKDIRQVFKGQERFAMLRTLRRQHGYSQKLRLFASVGFLLQIPFFFAAYHLLSHMPLLVGQNFGPIANLGAPDGLFHIFGWTINVLPLLMTGVNLASAFIYSRRMGKTEKIQLYGLAAVFLIALYNSPAGLTFYWTLNNLYSLGKNIVEKELLPKIQRPLFKLDLLRGLLAGLASKLPPLRFFILISAIILLGMLFLASWGQIGIVCCSLGIAGMAWFVLGQKKTLQFPVFTFIGICGTCVWLIASCCYFLLKLDGNTTTEFVFSKIEQDCWLVFFVMGAAWSLLYFCLQIEKGLTEKNRQQLVALLHWAWLLLCLLCFFILPVQVYLSDPGEAPHPLLEILPVVLGCGLLAFGLGLAGLSFLKKTEVVPASMLMVFLLFIALVYAFICTGSYGHLNGVFLAKDEALFQPDLYLYDFGIAAILLGLVTIIFYFKKFLVCKFIIIICLISLCADAAQAFIKNGVNESQKLADAQARSKINVPAYANEILNFSRDKPNLLVIVSDAFTGEHFADLLTDFPELQTAYADFTWYRDTMATGNFTYIGLLPIIAGENYANWQLKDVPLTEQAQNGFQVLPEILAPLGYQCSIIGCGYIDDGQAAKLSGEKGYYIPDKRFANDFANIWRKSQGQGVNKSLFSSFIFSIGVFKSVPYSMRKYIYQEGDWLGSNFYSQYYSELAYGPLAILQFFSTAESAKATYKYLYLFTTHEGILISPETGLPISTVPQATEDFVVRHPELDYRHYISEWRALQLLGEWFDWMKKAGVWKNTRIIIVSDHGDYDSAYFKHLFNNASQNRWDNFYKGRHYSLLLEKNFNSDGPLRISEQFMSTADVPELLLSGIAKWPRTAGNWQTPMDDPQRIRYFFAGKNWNWHECNPGKTYKITGSMFNPENWALVGEEECK